MRLIDRLIERPPRMFRMLVPEGIFRIPSGDPERRCVYLTFDDGPIPEVTPWVLDLLDRYGVKATFFMVGENVMRHPDLYAEILRRGHRAGNHTHHHIQGIKVSTERYLEDVAEAARLIESDLVRPPHGWLRPSQARALAGRYRIVMYDLVTRDYSSRLTADEVFDNVRRYARDGSIIVFHDSLKSRRNLESALPRAIEWLIEKGFEFRLVDSVES